MLEILSHQYLKRFMKSHCINWDHVYSFGRIISKFIQTHETYLINSEIFTTNEWVSALLISLFLNEEDSILVLSEERIEFLEKNQLVHLKTLGFDYYFENNQIIFKKHRISLITFEKFLDHFQTLNFQNYRIIFSEIEDFKQNLKNYFRISLSKKDWMQDVKELEDVNQQIISTYNFLKKKFFLRKSLGNRHLFLNRKEERFIAKFFFENSSFSHQFCKVSNALSRGWACWVQFDNTNFEWEFCLEPIDELSLVTELITNNRFIFLSALRNDNFFQNYLKNHNLIIDLVINFKSNFIEKEILLYVPPKQILPNNPHFTDVILDKCNKLIIFRNGLTLVLSDDANLKINQATELASKYGKTVLLETIPSLNNEILCASYDWWIKNSYLIQIPKQIIIPLLPIPNISEPINFITVSYNKKISRDWFREFFLPDAITKLDRSVSPLRRNSGKLIILDGRANKRKWGRTLLQSIQPTKKVNFMLPFD